MNSSLSQRDASDVKAEQSALEDIRNNSKEVLREEDVLLNTKAPGEIFYSYPLPVENKTLLSLY